MAGDPAHKGEKQGALSWWALLFWLGIWQLASMLIHQRLFLASPAEVVIRLFELARTASFCRAVLFSLLRIAAGYFLALFTGILLAAAAARFSLAEQLLYPLMLVGKAVPVASFIILLLLFLPSRLLAVWIAFLMVLPMVYTNVLQGICAADPQLLEMAGLFRLPWRVRLRCLYVPAVFPFLQAACHAASGFAFKAGIAAEVIGMPKGSIGERLQQAKVYLDTPDLFAWTLVVVALAFLFGKAHLAGLSALCSMIGRPPKHIRGMAEAEERKPPEVSIEALSKSFGEKTVLDGFSAVLPAGEATALMGPSGAGKTTLFRLLAGLEAADAGSVNGLTGARLSAVFQEDRLFTHLSGADNIRLAGGRAADPAWVAGALAAMGLGESRQPVAEYSGGMKRRVSLLRAAAADAEMLLLDEPFQGLDEKTRDAAIAWLKKNLCGRTVLLITHSEEEARLLGCRQVIRLPAPRERISS